MGARFRASVENTSARGGPLALQVRPLPFYTVVETYPLSDPLNGGLPKIVDWHTSIVGILEAEVAPTTDASPGFLSRPVIGRVAPPWTPNRNATLTPMGMTSYRPGDSITSGTTPNGTECTGPTFGSQISLPAFPGTSQKTFISRVTYPSDQPLLIYGAGTHDFSTDGPIIPTVAGVLYCRGPLTPPPPDFILNARSGIERQTYYGAIIFEEL